MAIFGFRLAAAFAVGALVINGAAQAQSLQPGLAGLAFLVGHWSQGRGVVAETGGTSTGSSLISVAANGGVLLRRDQTQLFDRSGAPSGAFEQVMMIYPEGGGIRADYSDGAHVIHYAQAKVAPGASVTFSSAGSPGAPVFTLTYTLTAPDVLAVAFAVTPPGSTVATPIAAGTLRKTS